MGQMIRVNGWDGGTGLHAVSLGESRGGAAYSVSTRGRRGSNPERGANLRDASIGASEWNAAYLVSDASLRGSNPERGGHVRLALRGVLT
jgi:hypothetical protein